jgi:hypothetical protein
MAGFLGAHGYDPGPTQRPAAAGALSGAAATVPATVVLAAFDALSVEARILGLSEPVTVAAGVAAMAAAGAAYGRLFGRAANDRRGGWLFGMAFGFLVWAAGAVMVLPLLSGGLTPAGRPAIGVCLSFLAWGTALGAAFPFVHRPLHADVDRMGGGERVGPDAAAPRARLVRGRAPKA